MKIGIITYAVDLAALAKQAEQFAEREMSEELEQIAQKILP